MINRHIDGAVRQVGKTQGFVGISVLYGHQRVVYEGEEMSAATVTTAWEPTPAELARLNQGASIQIELLMALWPPCLITVGEPPDA
jgi:hypothetical protein